MLLVPWAAQELSAAPVRSPNHDQRSAHLILPNSEPDSAFLVPLAAYQR